MSDDDDLSSSQGVDYTNLRNYLRAEQWREADKETLDVMLTVAGREEEGYLNIESINNFPCRDLCTIDQLWVKYSNRRFGFSVQQCISESAGGNLDANYQTWCNFCDRVGWRVTKTWLTYENLSFNTQVYLGHLPFLPIFSLVREEGWKPFNVIYASIISALASRLVNCNL